MKIKVCGMKYPENITRLIKLPIHFMGLIFYPKSPRYVNKLDLSDFPTSIKKVGVFVNADIDYIIEKAETFNLDMLQLHGNESPEYCKQIKEQSNLPIIKAFNISEASDFSATHPYSDCCDYFLFDTKTSEYGGSGQKFDWNILTEYKGEKPFFLSGGISENDAKTIKNICHPQLFAVDVNSKFEVNAAEKNIEQLNRFITSLK